MRDVLQTGSFALGILCLVYYIVIVMNAGIRADVAWIWIIGSGLFFGLNRVLVLRGRHFGMFLRITESVLLLLVVAGMIVTLVIGSRIIGGMWSTAEDGLEYVIVLGAQVKGTLPSRALRMRLDRAVSYAEENPETVFVLSGGQGEDEGISEAECMYNYLTSKGLSPKRLLLEDMSTSTRENLIYSDQLYGLKDRRVGILSNSFHICRALWLAREEGYGNANGIAAPSDPVMLPHNVMREICCILVSYLCR